MRGPSSTDSAFYFAMNNPNSDIQIEETPAEAESSENSSTEIQQPEFQPLDMRRRLRELLSVPERDRSDEVWDEIIELEIQLAPGNRISGGDAQSGQPRHNQPRHSKPAGHAGPGNAGPAGVGAQQKKHRPRTKNNRRPRPGGKPGGGTGEAA
jgi:hypothetical protein